MLWPTVKRAPSTVQGLRAFTSMGPSGLGGEAGAKPERKRPMGDGSETWGLPRRRASPRSGTGSYLASTGVDHAGASCVAGRATFASRPFAAGVPAGPMLAVLELLEERPGLHARTCAGTGEAPAQPPRKPLARGGPPARGRV